MGSVIKKTLCVLSASHFQQDLLHDWFDKWQESLSIRSLTPDVKSTIEVWDVSGPEEAFDELPEECFGTKYKTVLQDELMISHIY